MSDYIPIELKLQIINWLPVKSLLRFRSVSESWKSYIDSSSFVSMYGIRNSGEYLINYKVGNQAFMFSTNEALILYPVAIDILFSNHKTIGCSEGLWLFSYGNLISVTLWNPSIRKSIGIFVPVFCNICIPHKVLIGFGVPSETLDPTIVKISYPVWARGEWCVYVFTLSSEKWNQVPNNLLPREKVRFKRSSQTVVGNLIYWLNHELVVSYIGVCTKKTLLISFNMVDYHFEVIDIPDIQIQPCGFPLSICQFNKSLLLSGNIFLPDKYIFGGQLLTIDNGSITGYTVVYTMTSPYFLKLLGFTNKDEPIVEAGTSDLMGHLLQVFNDGSGSFNNVTGILGNAGSFYVGTYKESLILANYANHSRLCAGC